MKIKIILSLLLCSCFTAGLQAFGAGGGPGQGDYPVEATGFVADEHWPATDDTGKTYLNKIRAAQFPAKKQAVDSTNQDIDINSVEAKIMDDLDGLEERILRDIQAKLQMRKKQRISNNHKMEN